MGIVLVMAMVILRIPAARPSPARAAELKEGWLCLDGGEGSSHPSGGRAAGAAESPPYSYR